MYAPKKHSLVPMLIKEKATCNSQYLVKVNIIVKKEVIPSIIHMNSLRLNCLNVNKFVSRGGRQFV